MVKALYLGERFPYDSYLEIGCLVQVQVPFLMAMERSRLDSQVGRTGFKTGPGSGTAEGRKGEVLLDEFGMISLGDFS